MLNVGLSLRVMGEDGATSGGVAKEESSIASSPDSKGDKDAPSSHKQTSSLGELNLRPVSCDRPNSLILISNSTRC